MDIDSAREFIRGHHRAVLTTYRADGGAQMSPVTAGVDAVGRVIVSSTEDRAKVRNLRRDPRAALCVLNDGFFGSWVQVEGSAEVVGLPDGMEPLIEYYRLLAGEHPDWDDYRAAMIRDRRALIRMPIARAGGRLS